VELTDAIRRAAIFHDADQPDFPPGHPTRRFEVAGVSVILPDGLLDGVVFPERIEGSEVEQVVESVRRLCRVEQRARALWFVPEEASPEGLVRRLLTLGLRPNDLPGSDARYALMVCIEEPPPGPPDVVARPAATFEEFLEAQFVLADSFGMDETRREALVERAERSWPFQSEPGAPETFVALVEDEVVAVAAGRFGRSAVYLLDGGTRPGHRGRGAYTALVRARWDAAVKRGTPALTTGAGSMSRPILERLGFSILGWEDCLLDQLG
jgi:GNAT superfamily N-acetyltransferase